MEELQGCWREAQRADKVAMALTKIRAALNDEFFESITAVIRELESISSLLRDLYDLFPIYRARVPIMVYYLNIVLPSLAESSEQMLSNFDSSAFPARIRWERGSQKLGDQGGMSIAARLVMFSDFLVQLIRLLTRYVLEIRSFSIAEEFSSPLYEPMTLELLRIRSLRLRLLQGLPGTIREGLCPEQDLLTIEIYLAPPVPAQSHRAPLLTQDTIEVTYRSLASPNCSKRT